MGQSLFTHLMNMATLEDQLFSHLVFAKCKSLLLWTMEAAAISTDILGIYSIYVYYMYINSRERVIFMIIT